MTVEFATRTKELQNVIRQLAANRGQFSNSDFTDVLVSEIAATFRSVGTEAELSVKGIHPGAARVPFITLEGIAKVLPTFKQKEVTIVCEPGVIRIGTFSHKNPNIELGIIPDQQMSIPVDLAPLDMLALRRVLKPQQIVEQGLRERLEQAQRASSTAIEVAAAALGEFNVPEKQIAALVDEQIVRAAKNIGLRSKA